MKTGVFIGEEQLIVKGVEALIDRLGPVETSRFLALATPERIETVKRHRLWQANLDKEAFFDEVFGRAEEPEHRP
jgi:hypothetical protein